MDRCTLQELRDEAQNGLKIYAETAWGWSELKVTPFLKQVEQRNAGAIIHAIMEIRRDGSLTLKLPRRV